jgi:hypothetical protein
VSDTTPSPPDPTPSASDATVPAAVTSTFELLQGRLADIAASLATSASELNQRRAEQFKSTPGMTLAETERIRTERAVLLRDAVAVGDSLLVGMNSSVGLATQRAAGDIVSSFRLSRVADTDWDFSTLPLDAPTNVLSDPDVVRDIEDLYRYFSDAHVRTMRRVGDQLLIIFGTGSAASDIRVLRWRVGSDGSLTYQDAFGDHDVPAPTPFDFEWQMLGREHVVDGRWAHVNVFDTLFIGGAKGTLDVRIDDAVDGGRTIFTEPLAEADADITEARVGAVRLGDLVLVRVLPYREQVERFYVFNRLVRELHRADAIGRSCQQLPEDQGIVFAGGFHLQNGEQRVFATSGTHFDLVGSRRSPNGEDLLYVFHDESSGQYQLLTYNLVDRSMAPPILALGHAVFDDGTVVCLRPGDGAQRVHSVAIYTSPFCVPERYQPEVAGDSFFGRIGNPDLVRAVAEIGSLARDSKAPGFNQPLFEAIVARSTRLVDTYGWLNEPDALGLGAALVQLRRAAGAVLDEFASVTEARKTAREVLLDVERRVADFVASADLEIRTTDEFIERLAAGSALLGSLTQARDTRYVDAAALDTHVERARVSYQGLSARAMTFLGDPVALDAIIRGFDTLAQRGANASTAAEIAVLTGELDEAAGRLGLLSDVVSSVDADDPTQVTAVLGRLSDALARRNAARSDLDRRAQSLRQTESSAAFTTAMGVLGQRTTAALMSASTTEQCDDQLTTLLGELESIELRFGDVPEFASVIASRREELAGAFAGQRDRLAAERTARIDRVVTSAMRTLDAVVRRAESLPDAAAVDGFFATDPLAERVRRSVVELRALGQDGRASEIDVAMASGRDRARRGAADRSELFEDGTVRIGAHRFGVNREPFELRLDRLDGQFRLRLSGTELAQRAPDASLDEFGDLAEQLLVSETRTLPRALYLAFEADRLGQTDLRALATERVDEGYDLGIHDADAEVIAAAIRPSLDRGLRSSGTSRALAIVWFAGLGVRDRDDVRRQLQALSSLGVVAGRAWSAFADRHRAVWEELGATGQLSVDVDDVVHALVVAGGSPSITRSARSVMERFSLWAREHQLDLTGAAFGDLVHWIADTDPSAGHVGVEAAAALAVSSVDVLDAESVITIEGLRSVHPMIVGGVLRLDVGDALAAYRRYLAHDLDRFVRFGAVRRQTLDRWRADLGFDRLKAAPLASFVRNRLVDEVYLPLVGANLARQLGLSGPSQGLLLLVSPPGYGKTTLVEYVASLLGIALVKINGPALGSDVASLDPAAAPDATSAAELVKLNRALAMGTNVMLYIDDVQHTSPEFLQKFIPLCDATRRIEGVVDGEPRTFDFVGKRFMIVMAGNPYTSSGAAFRIPDMLANRADVHNLGDVVAGARDAFAQSYVENACGSNEVLAALVNGPRADLDALLDAAAGGALRTDQLARPISGAELSRLMAMLRHVIRVRDALMKVNAAYIESATLSDAMRGEPPFLLQGSYRNMARLAPKLVAAMEPSEVDALIADHYRAESQTLAAAAGWNLAKLPTVLGTATDADTATLDALRARWKESNVGADPASVIAASLQRIAQAF